MMEPFYVRQSREDRTPEQRREWFEMCAKQAQSEGAKLCRFSHHPTDENWLLAEGWDAITGDQGGPRFAETFKQ